jgi:hypothetical protein
MYHEIHKRHRDGFKPSQISRHLGIDRRTVRKYLAMSEEEYLEFIHSQKDHDKLLEPYEEFIKTRLENCTDASAAQVHDWLKEHHNDFNDVNEKTVFNFVLYVRNKYGIPKPFNNRGYEQVEELPFGKQAQADFGEYNMTTDEGKRKKIYFSPWCSPDQDRSLSGSRNIHLQPLQPLRSMIKLFITWKGSPGRWFMIRIHYYLLTKTREI